MGNIDIDSIWKDARKNSEGNFKLSKEEIDGFRMMRSGQIFSDIRKIVWTGLIIDIALFFALLFYMWFLNIQEELFFTLAVLNISIILVMIYSWITLNRIKRLEIFSDTIAARFEQMKAFFRLQFPLFQFISSLNNPLIVLTGVFYYLFFKYSEVRFSDIDDILVLTVILSISYILGYAGSRLGSSGLAREVNNLLSDEIYDDEYLAAVVRAERALKRKKLIAMSLVAIAGIVILVLLLVLNYTK